MKEFKKWLKKVTDIKNWKTKTKVIVCIVLAAVTACVVLSFFTPSREEMKNCVSEDMKELIRVDEQSTRKHVTQTYNSFGFINYYSVSSSGAKVISEKYLGFAGKIYPADKGGAKFWGQMVNYTYRMLGCGENLLHGAKLTIFLTVLTIAIGVVLGTFLALGKISKNVILSKLCGAYIFFFRGTPLLIQLFVIYFAIPGIFGFAWKDMFAAGDVESVYKGAFLAAVIGYGLNSGAYCAEIIRAAIQSIDKGQLEAAKSLGMTYGQAMSKIIIPQSVRRMLPPVCNEFIMVLKDVSLIFAFSLMDITTISKSIMTEEGSFTVFIPALAIYLVITAFFTFIFDRVEKRFSIYE